MPLMIPQSTVQRFLPIPQRDDLGTRASPRRASCSRSISRWTAARSRSSRSRLQRLHALERRAPGRGLARPMPVTRRASSSLRRSRSAGGKASAGHSPQRPGLLENRPGRQPVQVVPFQLSDAQPPRWPGRASGPRSGLVRPALTWSKPTFGRSSAATAVCRSTAALRISARTTSSVIRALCASRSANWSRAAASGIRAATASISVQERPAPLVALQVVPRGGPIEQVLEIRLRLPELLRVRRPAFAAGRRCRDPRRPAAPPRSPGSPRRPAARTIRTAAPWPAASGSKLRTTFDANRRSSCACAGVSAVPHEATTRRCRPAAPARSRNSPRPGPRSRLRRIAALRQVAARRASGPSSRSASRASSGTSGSWSVVHRPAAERDDRRRVSRQIGIISRFRNRSTSLPSSRSDDEAAPRPASPARIPAAQELRLQRVARRRRVAEAEALDRLRRQAAAVEQASRRGARRAAPAAPGTTRPRPRALFSSVSRSPPARAVLVAVLRLGHRHAELLRPAGGRRRETRPCSCSSTNLKTSPPTPQPKQWKKPLSRLTWNDGVFSPWNGQRPL